MQDLIGSFRSAGYTERVYEVLSWLDMPKESRPDFMTLYFDQPDHAGHSFGPESDGVIWNCICLAYMTRFSAIFTRSGYFGFIRGGRKTTSYKTSILTFCAKRFDINVLEAEPNICCSKM